MPLQPPYSGARTPPEVLDLLPGAFSACQSVNLSPADWDKRRGELLEGVRHGDGMFFRGWFDDGYNAKIKELYDQVFGAAWFPRARGMRILTRPCRAGSAAKA